MPYVPYWLQMAIYPFIKDTVCYYCIFIRGFIAGVCCTIIIGGVAWVGYSHYETRKSAEGRSLSKGPPTKNGSCVNSTCALKRLPGGITT